MRAYNVGVVSVTSRNCTWGCGKGYMW